MNELTVTDLQHRYGTRIVLQDVAFSVTRGTVALVAGRSGSGKSTLFSLLAGLERPWKGTIRYGSEEVAALTEEERTRFRLRQIGLVFQDFRLIPDLTVRENVELPARLAGRGGAGRRADALLRDVGLGDRGGSFPDVLSGGEQQRVALARALVNDPALLLADEPTANLDEENARIVLDLLRAAALRGRLVVMVSHDPLATPYADVAFELVNGRMRRKPNARLLSAPNVGRRDPSGAGPAGPAL